MQTEQRVFFHVVLVCRTRMAQLNLSRNFCAQYEIRMLNGEYGLLQCLLARMRRYLTSLIKTVARLFPHTPT